MKEKSQIDFRKIPETLGSFIGFRDTNIGPFKIPGSKVRGVAQSTLMGLGGGYLAGKAFNWLSQEEDERTKRNRKLLWSTIGATAGLIPSAILADIARRGEKAQETKKASEDLERLIKAIYESEEDPANALNDFIYSLQMEDLEGSKPANLIISEYASQIETGDGEPRVKAKKELIVKDLENGEIVVSKKASWGFWNSPGQRNAAGMVAQISTAPNMTPFSKALATNIVMDAAKQDFSARVGYNDLIRAGVGAAIGAPAGIGIAKVLGSLFGFRPPRAGTFGGLLGAGIGTGFIGNK